jgi:predicted DNA-binding transcriptional regulator AlpA
MQSFGEIIVDRMLTINDLCYIFCFKKTKIYEMIKQRKLPAPIKISPKASRWDPEAINEIYRQMLKRGSLEHF